MHTIVCLVVVAGVVLAMAPLEYVKVPWLETTTSNRAAPSRAMPAWCGAVGIALIGVGLLAISATGLEGFPFGRIVRYAGVPLSPGLSVIVMIAGTLMVRASGRRPGAST